MMSATTIAVVTPAIILTILCCHHSIAYSIGYGSHPHSLLLVLPSPSDVAESNGRLSDRSQAAGLCARFHLRPLTRKPHGDVLIGEHAKHVR